MSNNIIYPAAWWLIITLLGAAVSPLLSRLLPALPDFRGASKLFGVLLLAYLSWLLSYLLGHTQTEILLVFLSILAAGIITRLRVKSEGSSHLSFHEALFAASFFLFTLLRSYYPDINGQEKFMDFAMLNAAFNARSFPPPDPWLAGGHLDFYYYFGHLIIATLGKLTGTPPEVAYNLGLAAFFALAVTTTASLGYNLTGQRKYALFAVFFILLTGNLKSIYLALKTVYLGFQPGISYYWDSSRVIPNTVNEFPGFTFLQGDLHAHLAAIPLQILYLLCLLNLYRCARTRQLPLGVTVFTGFILGALFPTHSWDYPTYLILTALVLLYAAGINRWTLTRLLILLSSSLLLFTPFHAGFTPAGISGLKLVTTRTSLADFTQVFGLPLLPITLFLLHQAAPALKRACPIRLLQALAVLTILAPVSLLLDFQLLAPLLSLLLLCLLILKKHKPGGDAGLILLFSLTALFISLFCEVFYFDDAFSPPLERYNTVFKLYMQIWLLFTTAGVYAIYTLTPQMRGNWKRLWHTLILLMLLGGLIFPTVAILVKTQGFSNQPGLDGMAYLERYYPGDYQAVKWIRTHLSPDSVILERWGESYTLTGRISTNTGIPTVLGWAGHEIIWRSNTTLVNQRIRDVNTLYTTQNTTQARRLLEQYHITHIYTGAIEHEKYKDRLLAWKRNTTLLTPVYEDPANSTIIYEVHYS